MWPDRSEVETHIVRIGHISGLELDLDNFELKKEAFLLATGSEEGPGDKRLGDGATSKQKAARDFPYRGF
jgi:hypothetical protein